MTRRNNPEIWLMELFQRLRDADFRLGTGDYLLLQDALKTNTYSLDQYGLKLLCQTLWIKSAEQQRQFEAIFEEWLNFRKRQPPKPLKSSLPDSQPTQSTELTQPFQKPVIKKRETLEGATQDYFFFLAAQNGTKTALTPDAKVATAIKTRQPRDWVTVPKSRKNSEYLPVTPAQMQQEWYALKRNIQVGTKLELDIVATIEQTKRQPKGVPPVLKPRCLKSSSLFLLIDFNEGMQPFQGLARQLVSTALQTGCLASDHYYYVNDYRQESFYSNLEFTQKKTVAQILTLLKPERTKVMIFSDADAAKREYSRYRFQAVQDFLKQWQPRVKNLVWLNPLPQQRWHQTTAEAIDKLPGIQMFQADYAGFRQAIEALK